MKRKIISMLMTMVILFTSVDLSVFASGITMSDNEVQSVVEEVTDGSEDIDKSVIDEETTVLENEAEQKEGTSGVEETEAGKDTEEKDDNGGNNEEQDSVVNGKDEDVQSVEDAEEKEGTISANFGENTNSTVTASGQCGDNLTWILSNTGTLTISGTGDMWELGITAADTEIPWKSYRDMIKKVELGNGVTNIANCSFYECTNLETIIFNSSINSIGNGAFEGCISLQSLPEIEGIQSIGVNVFYNSGFWQNGDNWENGCLYWSNWITDANTSGEKCVIRDNTVGVASAAFSWDDVTEVVMPNSIRYIEDDAFGHCMKLEKIRLSNNLCRVGASAFEYTYSLNRIVIPEGVTEIPTCCFLESGIDEIALPKSVEKIGNRAFRYGNNFVNDVVVYYQGNMDEWEKISYYRSENSDLVVYYHSYNDYVSIVDGWDYSENKPTIWSIFEADKDIEYNADLGYNCTSFNINITSLCMIPIDNSDPTYENVTVTIELPEGLSFSAESEERSWQKNLGTMSLSGTKRQDMSFTVYIDEKTIKEEFSVNVKLTADGYETPQSNTYNIPVSIIKETMSDLDTTIINTVDRYTSDKEVQEILDIFNNSSSDEEIRRHLFEYYNYDNMLDVRERIIELSDMHDERWDYEGLIRDDMYLSWQYYDYLNNTPKGAAARVALYASGLVFNGEINEWIDPTTYIDSELPGIKKYKSLLEEFIQKQSSSIEQYTYMSEAEKFINSTVGIWSKTEKAEVIKKMKEAPDSVTCESIFNDFVANKISNGEKTMTYVYDADEKPMFMEAMGITDTVFSVINVTMDGIAGIVDISSNLETYQVYHSFLQEIYEADDLPWELVVAAYQLDQELEQAYWTPIQGILNEIRDECLDEAFDAAGFKNLLNKNGWLSAINYTAFCINQFVDIGELVVNSCHTEGYVFLAMHYKNKLEECKKQFLANKTEENAWAFYEAYIMLWKLRIAGEEKFLQMSKLEGGTVVDGLSEAATGGTIAGLISDLCGYADKEAAINDNLKMLDGFSFNYSIKDEDLPDKYKYLQKIVIECPVSVEILMADGTQVCVLNDGVETEITNEHGTFVSFYRATTGDYAKIAYFNDDAQYMIRAIGQDSGSVTYSSAKTEDHLTCSIEGFDNVIISKNDIIYITTDDEKYTIDKEGDGTTDIEGELADKNKIFVQFDYQDGKQIQVKYVNENGMVTMPETPLQEGYRFKGWFTGPGGLGEEFTTATVINRSMTVYAKWESKETLSTVTANIETGSVVEKGTEIILSCATEGVQIYYTIDETNPTIDSILYTSPIALTEATTIKAIAVKEGCNNSEVTVFTYTIAEKQPSDQNDKLGTGNIGSGQEIQLVKVKKVKVTGISKKIAAGKRITLKAAVTPADATNKAVKWTTSNKKWATVSSKGVVTLKKAGAGKSVTITATAKDGSGVKATYKIKIMKDAVKTVKITTPSKAVTAGKSLKLKATVTTTGKSVNKTLQWTSSNTKYATVFKSGKVTAKKVGKGKTVIITAMATDGSGKKAKVKIKIK